MEAEHLSGLRRALAGIALLGLLLGVTGALPAAADEDLCLGIDADGDGVIDQLPPPPGCIVVPFLVEPEKNNTIDLAFHTIHVAVPWTPTFDYNRIRDMPLCFGDADDPSQRACTPVGGKSKFRDVNGDGKVDRVWKWDTGLTGVQPGDTSACVYGTTTDGAKIEACDRATVINGTGPALYVNDVSVTEGNSGLKPVTFTVTLTPASAGQVTVDYATADYTASAPADYQSTSGQLTFEPGETSKPVTVYVVGDTAVELNESFSLNLSAPVGAVIGDVRGNATIANDDAAANPLASIGDVTVTEGNSGTTIASFAVTISPAASQPVSVSWATADGTAVSPDDYQSAFGVLSFAPGEASKTVDVQVVGEVADEASEVFYVNISSSDVGVSDSQGVGTITNDDTQFVPSISISDVTMAEGNSGSQFAVFVVTLSGASANQVTVGYATANGKALAPSDYQAVTGTLVFAPGEGSKTIQVTVFGDTLSEREENFFVNLSGATGATIADAQGKCLIQNDDG